MRSPRRVRREGRSRNVARSERSPKLAGRWRVRVRGPLVRIAVASSHPIQRQNAAAVAESFALTDLLGDRLVEIWGSVRSSQCATSRDAGLGRHRPTCAGPGQNRPQATCCFGIRWRGRGRAIWLLRPARCLFGLHSRRVDLVRRAGHRSSGFQDGQSTDR